MKLVLDSSVLVKFFLDETHRTEALAILEAIRSGECSAHVPDLAIYEVLSTLTKRLEDESEIRNHLAMFKSFIEAGLLVEHALSLEALQRAAAIACHDTLGHGYISSYDASFHALALELGATFVTADASHVRKTAAPFGSVSLLSELAL